MEHKEWRKRIVDRTDSTSRLTHLTRSTYDQDAFEVLIDILESKRLIGSTTSSGFIVGKRKAVCFQEVPLLSVGENIIHENRNIKEYSRLKYEAYGIRVNKQHAFRKGARPVIYGLTSELKEMLPSDEWWRIVHFDISTINNMIDWTHEREWRIPDSYRFNYSDIEIILPNAKAYKRFINYCIDNDRLDMLSKINGIICLDSVVK